MVPIGWISNGPHPVSVPLERIADRNLSLDLRCRRNTSIDVYLLVRGRIREIRDILALGWCPGVIVFHL